MLISEAVGRMEGVIRSQVEKDGAIKGSSLDSRLVKEGYVFFAVKGESLDGNVFASDALASGATLVVMDDEKRYDALEGNKILVEDTVVSMKSFGRLRFSLNKIYTVVVTGSFGKTGAKEMIKDIFSQTGRVYATVGNKNNELGAALTGCGIDDEADVLVIEIGTSAYGEIAELSKTVAPDMAVVISAGYAHIGRFGSLENIIAEKLSVTEGLKKGGVLIIPQKLKPFVEKGDYRVLTFGEAESADIYMTGFEHKGFYSLFTVNDDDTVYRINHPYIHAAQNSLAAILAAKTKNVPTDKIAAGLALYKPVKGHGSVSQKGDIFLIDDTYNAGFESMIKAVESLHKINISPKYAILGEMGEINGFEPAFYGEIAALAEKYPDINFYLCGDFYKEFPELPNRKIFSQKTRALAEAGEINKGAVLVKASRGKRFEEFVEMISRKAEGL